jgi:hypothetical protein
MALARNGELVGLEIKSGAFRRDPEEYEVGVGTISTSREETESTLQWRDGAARRAYEFESRDGLGSICSNNEYRSAQINGNAGPGYSSDQTTSTLQNFFRQTLPSEMGFGVAPWVETNS